MTSIARVFIFSLICFFAIAFLLTILEINGAGRRASLVSIVWISWLSGLGGLVVYSIMNRFCFAELKPEILSPQSNNETSIMCTTVLFAMLSGSMLWTYEIVKYVFCFAFPVCLIFGIIDRCLGKDAIVDEVD